ncbi:MAG: nicotinamide-nucleotide amidohydrolase family protein [Acidimicrobiia bacterium]|nr:nicotinamide-nucleotide amidohydrolase family protein [Acidimicrobiia bacterium]
MCELVGDVVFGRDTQTMESVVLDLLRERGWSLGLAESVTGGLVSGRLTSIPGSSEVLRGCVVSYASDVKFDVLDVPRGPVVSEAAAIAMAEGARRVLGASVGLSLTGVAGPSEQDGQPVGTLWVGVAMPDRPSTATLLRMPGQRDQILIRSAHVRIVPRAPNSVKFASEWSSLVCPFFAFGSYNLGLPEYRGFGRRR